ncbi:MAG: DUF4416 family protein [Planctomycetes bacterium]|nr:DUF4416 family protein [Planctomycetota bacterium]
MASVESPKPVKLFIAALWRDPACLHEARRHLSERFGAVDYESPAVPFDLTDYYEAEMGTGLQRSFLSLARPVPPDLLPAVKLFTNGLESRLAGPSGRRSVNLDPGYLDASKVVLASAKYGPQKIYLGQGIWADFTLRYQKGRFHPFEWTFPDFRDSRYDAFLLRIRELYKTRR